MIRMRYTVRLFPLPSLGFQFQDGFRVSLNPPDAREGKGNPSESRRKVLDPETSRLVPLQGYVASNYATF